MLSQPEFWAGVPVMYIYGLFMFGGWAVLLGELGWLIVSNVSAIQRMSIQVLIPIVAATGGLVGYINVIAWHAFGQAYFPSGEVWYQTFQQFKLDGCSIAGLVGGVVCGVLIAYHCSKEQHDPSSNRNAALVRVS